MNKYSEKKNSNLYKYATLDSDAIYFEDNVPDEYRTSFFRDIDRILYSLAYLRYKDKTQVFSYPNHDHVTKRIIHVQSVSKIARTIGRCFGLNEDLIEAASLGHDLGHTPFGHVGEAFLNEISLAHNEGYFNHNVESVRVLMNIENHGLGKNITVQTLDAIMCHNGELVLGKYAPVKKTKEDFLKEYYASYHDKELLNSLRPMTLEGCVVRISDLIAYLGRDIEDAIRINIIKEEDLPQDIMEVLGRNNREIVNTIIKDVINNSMDKPYIMLSEKVYESINKLKDFNYEHIYKKAYTDEERNNIKTMLNTMFDKYVDDIVNNNLDSHIVSSYLSSMSEEYCKNSPERIAIDYIAGMTDDYILKEYHNYLNLFHNKREV